MDISALLTSLWLAMLVDAVFGWPDALYRRIGHPVSWLGGLIAYLDRAWNCETLPQAQRRRNGQWVVGILMALALSLGIALEWWLWQWQWPWAVGLRALLLSSLLAHRSLVTHVVAVEMALRHDGLSAGRQAVAQIVGRRTEMLDETGVSRAAIESLAENSSDGVFAPLLWGLLGGLPGLLLYKSLNTADSMIGHLNARYADFGRAAAKLDDGVNLPASRFSAALLALASGRHAGQAWRCVRRDARRHRSPNAGWPEAAMAGALGIALGGPRCYDTQRQQEPWLNAAGRRSLTAHDIARAVALYRRAWRISFTLIGVLAGLTWIL